VGIAAELAREQATRVAEVALPRAEQVAEVARAKARRANDSHDARLVG